MTILFIYNSLPKGGIETFFLRITKKLVSHGHNVKFLFFSENYDVDLITDLKLYSEIFSINEYLIAPKFIKKSSPILKLIFPIRKKLIFKEILFDIDHIHAPDFNSILFANKVLNNKIPLPISTGVYHINEFNFTNNKYWSFVKFIDNFFQELPPENILFFNEICKKFYNDKYNNKFCKSIVTPIGIEIPPISDVYYGKQNDRIVSIGRLAKWKTYNYHMIQVIHSLKQKGIIIYYDSYGSGGELDNLRQKASDLCVEELATFHSGVPYSEFKTVLKDKLMFIGAGTAIIEASATGIPAMIGIENENNAVTFGFLHNTNTYSYQENQLTYERESIENLIINLKNCNAEKYYDECKNAKKRAQDFSIDKTYDGFIQMLNNSKYFKFHLNYCELIFIFLGLFINKVCFPKSNYSQRL